MHIKKHVCAIEVEILMPDGARITYKDELAIVRAPGASPKWLASYDTSVVAYIEGGRWRNIIKYRRASSL